MPEPPEPAPQPPPPAPARKPRRVIRFGPKPPAKEKLSVGNIIMGSLCITAAAGVVLAIAIPSMLSSQGARYSVRIEWERRKAEIDAIADRALREGKLSAPEAAPGE